MPLPEQARRVAQLPPYLFVEVTRKINEKRALGEDVISLAIGDPDLPSAPHVIEALQNSLKDVANHRYPESDGLPAFRRAVAEWYKRRFDVDVDPDTEVLPTIGSKEGIAHIAWCYIDPGDIALVPDPGYPVYSVGTMLAGGESHFMPSRAKTASCLILMPYLKTSPVEQSSSGLTTQTTRPPPLQDSISIHASLTLPAQYDIVVCHDGPYTEVAFDGYKPVSFLQAPGAKDVGIEFHSLSKSYNMTGWRIGMTVGNAEVTNALMRIKSNVDSGIFQAVQHAGIAALEGPQEIIDHHNGVYQARRDKLIPVLRDMELAVDPPKASLYVWAKLPDGVLSGEFASRLIEEANVVVTPGRGYGEAGEGYIRCSLTVDDDALDRALERLSAVDTSLLF